MKTYTSPDKLLHQIETNLETASSSSRPSPLAAVADALCRGRHYTWAGIYLTAGDNPSQRSAKEPRPEQIADPETRSKVLVSIKLAGHELGVLDIESNLPNAIGVEDRVLLERVAGLLARFLSGRGKYIVRKTRRASPALASAVSTQ